MTTEKDNGGAAFPSPNDVKFGEYKTSGHRGMTLRDYFAAYAPIYPFAMPEIYPNSVVDPASNLARLIAEWNYAYADAMLKERGK